MKIKSSSETNKDVLKDIELDDCEFKNMKDIREYAMKLTDKCLDYGKELDDLYGLTENMAEYEAQQEAKKEDVHEYTKGNAMNIGEEI